MYDSKPQITHAIEESTVPKLWLSLKIKFLGSIDHSQFFLTDCFLIDM